MTEAISLGTRVLLVDAVRDARVIAARIGSQHVLWDIIFDAEALLDGRETVLRGTSEEVAQKCLRFINEECMKQ